MTGKVVAFVALVCFQYGSTLSIAAKEGQVLASSAGAPEDMSFYTNQCPLDNHELVLLADRQDCGKYYVCDWGSISSRPCPAGLYFNTDISDCDWPQNVQCNVVSQPDDGQPEDGGESDGSGDQQESGDGAGDPEAGDGSGDPETEDGSGDPEAGDGSGDPEAGNGSGDPQSEDGSGDPEAGDGSGDPETEDGSGNPEAGDGSGDPEAGDGSGDPETDDESGNPEAGDGSGNAESGDNSGSQNGGQPDNDDVGLYCPLMFSGYLPHPRDCHKFYYCFVGRPVVYKCSYNWVWNESISSCVLPQFSYCFSG